MKSSAVVKHIFGVVIVTLDDRAHQRSHFLMNILMQHFTHHRLQEAHSIVQTNYDSTILLNSTCILCQACFWCTVVFIVL